MEYKVGMKVVCIATFPKHFCNHLGVDCPIKDEIYTISALLNLPSAINKKVSLCFQFKELSSGINGYGAEWFRPLDKDFAEEVLANITEQIETEELVLV